MKALIDSDSLIYRSGFSFEEKSCWNELEMELGIDTVPEVTYTADLLLAKNAIDAALANILFNTGCDDFELWLSGKGNFRYDVLPTYKSNRANVRRPLEYQNLFNYLVSKYKANIATGYEADDMVVALKTYYPDDYVLCAIDKDVLYQTVGRHYNYNKSEYIEVTQEEADRFFWFQVLSGDGVDGYKGCNGIGKVKANRILMECDSNFRDTVEKIYEEAGHTKEQFLTMCRVANMHQLVLSKEGNFIQLFE